MSQPLPAGTICRLYIAQLEKLSAVTYRITEYLGRGSYAIQCVETGIRTFAHVDSMRQVTP